MRWPFGPPHLTFKPSKKKKSKQKTGKTNKKNKNTKNSFSFISHISFLLWVPPNFLFLTTWPKERAPKKHYKHMGFQQGIFWKRDASRNGHFWTKKSAHPKNTISIWGFSKAFFEKEICVTKRPFLDNKKNKSRNSRSSYSVLANQNKDNFQNLSSKHRKLKKKQKKNILHPFFENGYF